MKKLMMMIALAGLLTGCSWVSSSGRGTPSSSGAGTWRGADGISTGADVGGGETTR